MKDLLFRMGQYVGLIVISLGLIFGGIAIVQTDIPFWNLVYGLPAIFIGIGLSILTFNEIATHRGLHEVDYHYIRCKFCGKNTLTPKMMEEAMCVNCQYKTALKVQGIAVTLFLFLVIPVTYHLSQEKQTIDQQAKEKQVFMCEPDAWMPQVCQCGIWNEEDCEKGMRRRTCGDGIEYCCGVEDAVWECTVFTPSPT